MSGSDFLFGRDQLTGLATLHDLLAREAAVDAECRASSPPAVYGIVLIDVVGLSAFNQRYGLEAGDMLLRDVAQRLCKALADPPPLCLARVGGDDFAVLVRDVVLHHTLSQLARKIRIEVAGSPFPVSGEPLNIKLRTTFRYGPNPKAHKSDLLWDVQRADRIDATRELHQRLEALEKRQGVATGNAPDLRERLAAAERRARLGEYDELTGLRNRRGMNEALAGTTGPRVVGFVDLDNLRELNALDDANWATGDAALSTVGRLLGSFGPGAMAGRWGGDEFVLVVPGCDPQGVLERLCTLNDEVAEQMRFGDLCVSFSAGVASADGQEDHEAAQAAAQAKAREAKAMGRAQVRLAGR